MTRRRNFVARAGRTLAGVLMLVAAGCRAGADLPPVPAIDQTGYRLGPGDEIRVITFGEDQLTGTFKVSDGGEIALPLLGPVPASGRTVGELQQGIVTGMKAKEVFRNPSVSIEVATYRPFFILGEVSRPGQYPYQPGMTTLSAVAVAGGFTYRAVTDRVTIVRHAGETATEGRAGRETSIAPGDVITVQERFF